MLCSISTQKSKWLDRLRSSKGFPSADNLNLQQFLDHNSSASDPVPENPDSNRARSEKEQVPESSSVDGGGGKELFNAFSNVLAELFNMGEPSNCPGLKKGSRKQINPRCFSGSASPQFENVCGVSPMSDDQSRVELIEKANKNKVLGQRQDLIACEVQGEDEEEELEKMDASLMGFSRSEVTVIDTSFAPWKFDKLLFRKKNVWKVRDKRTKTPYFGKKKKTHFGKKKRKLDDEDDNVGGMMKKQKVSSGEEGKFRNVEGLPPRDKFEEVCKKTIDNVGRSLEKKHRDFALMKSNSSVVLIKHIPTSKKSTTGISKSSPKPSHHRPPKA